MVVTRVTGLQNGGEAKCSFSGTLVTLSDHTARITVMHTTMLVGLALFMITECGGTLISAIDLSFTSRKVNIC